MKKLLSLVVILFTLATSAAKPKYIFLFIGDGMSTAQRMVADEFARKTTGEGLAMRLMVWPCH